MASKVYNAAKDALTSGGIDWDSDDIRVLLVATNTTADTENDGKVHLSDITTMDECNGPSYARQALANKTDTTDDVNDRAVMDADDIIGWLLGASMTRAVQGAVIYKYVDGVAAHDLLIAYIDFSATLPTDAQQFDLNWDSAGIIFLT